MILKLESFTKCSSIFKDLSFHDVNTFNSNFPIFIFNNFNVRKFKVNIQITVIIDSDPTNLFLNHGY